MYEGSITLPEIADYPFSKWHLMSGMVVIVGYDVSNYDFKEPPYSQKLFFFYWHQTLQKFFFCFGTQYLCLCFWLYWLGNFLWLELKKKCWDTPKASWGILIFWHLFGEHCENCRNCPPLVTQLELLMAPSFKEWNSEATVLSSWLE